LIFFLFDIISISARFVFFYNKEKEKDSDVKESEVLTLHNYIATLLLNKKKTIEFFITKNELFKSIS